MIECKLHGRQHDALFMRLSAILRVADDGRTEFRQMNAYLVLTPGVKLDAKKCELSATFCHIECGDGALSTACGAGGMDGAIGPLDQKALDSSGGFLRNGGNNRVIEPGNAVMEKLFFERIERRIVFGKDEQSRGIAIEAMDQSRAGGWIRKAEIFTNGRDGCGARLARDRAGEKAGRFVDDENVLVFMNNHERQARLTFNLFRLGVDGDAVLRHDRLIESQGGCSVDHHAVILHHSLERLPAGVGKIMPKAVDEGHG